MIKAAFFGTKSIYNSASYLLLVVALCLQFGLQAQTGERKKIALVLSGGAAHGLAHIGAIKYLEEQGIKPDIITGTSMGAVIGGLYALGYTADDLMEIAASQDWDLLMSNHVPLNEIAPVEKKYHERIPLSLYWNDDNFSLPPGIIRGQRLDINLSNLFIGAYNLNNFDELHIPYRCVAIDLLDGSIDVFSEGYMADAIRASMAIPTIFPPKELNGRLYVDGGLLRNFPVQEAIDMGADIIIGVFVGVKPMHKKELVSMMDILEQSAFMGSTLDSDEQIKNVDVLITPKVKHMNRMGFNNHKLYAKLGYEAAQLKAKELQSVSSNMSVDVNAIYRKRFTSVDSINIDQLTVKTPSPAASRLVNQKLKGMEGSVVAVDDLEKSLSLVYGTRNFSKTSYSFDVQDSLVELKFNADPVVPYNIGVSANRFRQYNTALILNAEARGILGKLSNLRVDTRISENPGIQGQYYNRIAGSPSILLGLYGKTETFELPFINDDVTDRLYNYRDTEFRIEIMKEWNNSVLMSLAYGFQFDRIKPEVFKADGISKYSSNRQQVSLSFEYNKLDRQVYPTSGRYILLNNTFVLSNTLRREFQDESNPFLDFDEASSYFKLEFDYAHYYSLSKVLCLEFTSTARISTADSFLDHYKVGGPFQRKNQTLGFVGIEESEFLVGDHVSGQFGFRFKLKDTFFITPSVHYLYGLDFLSYVYERDKNISLLGFGIQLGLDTPIGPISFDAGYSNLTDEINLNLGVGYRHIF